MAGEGRAAGGHEHTVAWSRPRTPTLDQKTCFCLHYNCSVALHPNPHIVLIYC